jgi:hypothetical protein
MRSRVMQCLALGVVVAAAGCGASVHTAVAPNANLSQYRTYRFSDDEGPQVQSVADQYIHEALRQSLAAKGFVEAKDGPADLLVSHRFREQEELESTGGLGYYGYGFGGVYTYTEGTLIVDLIDPKTMSVVWRGTASEPVDDPSSPNQKQIDNAVAKMINKLPPSGVAAIPRPTM